MNDNYFDTKRQEALLLLRATRDALERARTNRTNGAFGNLEKSYTKLEKFVSKIDTDFNNKFNTLVKQISQPYINRNTSVKNLVTKGGLFSGGPRLNLNKAKTIKVRDMDAIITKLMKLKANKNAQNKINANEKKAQENEKRRLNAAARARKEQEARNKAEQLAKQKELAKKEADNRKFSSINKSLQNLEVRLSANNGPRSIEMRPMSIQDRIRGMNRNQRTRLATNVLDSDNTMKVINAKNLNTLKPQTLTALKNALNSE
jgi:hypothetical protein